VIVRYSDGTEARLGDRVRISNGETGKIVFSLDTDEFTAEYPKRDWAHLKSGVMVLTTGGALVRFQDPLDSHVLEKIKD
jgi:hypothetical protein